MIENLEYPVDLIKQRALFLFFLKVNAFMPSGLQLDLPFP